MSKTLSVSAIHHGTVIDHITSGEALRIISLLKLLEKKHKVTVGLNLPSKRLGLKDIIKIEDHVLTHQDANDITIFAPEATINIIRDFEVVDKVTTSLPDSISNVFACANPNCITQSEGVKTFFHIESQGKTVNLTCQFCEKTFTRNQLRVAL
jgi:aspartate carbamoyltransferase regulatory subunit